MSKNTFPWHFKNAHFFEQHIITKENLHKSFIRDIVISETEEQDIKVVDNWASINDFFYKDLKPKSIKIVKYDNESKKEVVTHKKDNALKIKIGSLLHLNYPILRNKFWDKIRLQVPIMPNAKPVDLIRLVKNLKKSSLNNKTKKRKLLPVQLIKPIKGGFTVRFLTIKGFLPKKHLILAKNALDKKCEKLNPLNDLKKHRTHFFNTNKFAHIFTHFRNPKLYLENKKELVLPYINATKSSNEKISIIEKYNFLKEKTNYFENSKIKKTFFNKNITLNNTFKIKLPLKFTNTKFSYLTKKAIFVKKRKLGKRKFFKRNFDMDLKNNQKFHKLHSTVFFYDKYKHSNKAVFKPKFIKKRFNNAYRKFKNKPVFNQKKNFPNQKKITYKLWT